MKTYSLHSPTAGWIVGTCFLTIAVICGISLVQGQDVSDPLQPVRQVPAADPTDPAATPPGAPAPRRRSAAKPPKQIRIIPLKTTPVAEVINTLRRFVAEDAVQLSANDRGNALVVQAEPKVVEAIQSLVEKIDQPQSGTYYRAFPNPGVRHITLGTPIRLPGPSTVVTPTQYGTPVLRAYDPVAAESASKYQKLAMQIADLVKTYRETKDKRKQREIHNQIQDLTEEQFDLRQKGRELEVERLKKRVTEVAGSVQKRKSLKDKIVERRVEDVLNGPNDLQWEDARQQSGTYYSTTTPEGAYGYRPAPARQTLVGPIRPNATDLSSAKRGSIPETRIIPQTVTRQIAEQVIGPDGKPKTVIRTVTEIVKVEVPVSPTGPAPQTRYGAPDSGAQFPSTVPVPINFPRGNANLAAGTTVSEAEARVRIVERKLKASQGQHVNADRNGLQVEQAELEGDLEIARLQLEQAKRAHEATRRLIDLEMRRATAALDVAKTELEEAKAINSRIPNSLPQTTIRLKEAAVQQAQLAIERAQTWLELHRGSKGGIDSGNEKKQPSPRDESTAPAADPATNQFGSKPR